MLARALCLLVAICLTAALYPVVGRDDSGHAVVLVSGGRVHDAFNPATGKIFVLVIGNDARSGNPDRSRADAIHIVGINTETMRGGILNFPRDSYVDIPGHGSGKITEALFDGGPDLLVRTLEKLTGIRIDYWVMTGFQGFQKLFEGIGRIKIHLAQDFIDPGGSGARLQAGTHRLRYWEALAFARTRKVLARGDIARSANQGRLLLAVLRKFNRAIDNDAAMLLRWIALVREHTRLDIPPRELFELGVLATQTDPARIDSVTVPVTVGSVGAASVVFISSRARSIYRRFDRTGSL